MHDDIAAVVAAAQGRCVKVILENAYLSDEQKAVGCRLAEQAGARFVKTSTGFAPGGATLAARHRGEPAPVVSPAPAGSY